MPLITRQSKGSKLSIVDLDGNLQYLEGLAQQGGGGGGSSYYDNGNSSQNTVIDWSRGSLQELGIDNDPTLSFTGATAGQKLTLLLSREVSESRTITWSDGIFWKNGKTFDLKVVSGVALDEGFNIGEGFIGESFGPIIVVIEDGPAIIGDGPAIIGDGPAIIGDGPAIIGDGVFGGGGLVPDVRTIAFQSDGKILVGGSFIEFDGGSANNMVRLNTDGSRDTGFGIGSGFNSAVQSIALQSDGKILVGGSFTEFDGGYSNGGLVRLNADGSLDSGFSIGAGFTGSRGAGQVFSIALQSDGKILVGGFFTSFDGSSANNLVRLNVDGSLDTDFDIGDGFNGGVDAIALQPDGGILVGGFFTEFDGGYSNSRLVRLNVDGSLDTDFDIGDGFNDTVLSIAIQIDSKILVGGDFTSFDGNSANHLVRLNPDGSLDTDFDIGDGFNDDVNTIVLQPDGRILVGGYFNSFDGNYSNGRLVRLNADGSLDTGFDIGDGFNDDVYIITLQSDGKILVGGFFTEFDGNGVKGLARLIALSGDIYTPVNIYYTGTRYIGDYNSDTQENKLVPEPK
jgi:uncharacterized delta-60 repeat protein